MRKRILSSTNYKLPCSKPANQNCFDKYQSTQNIRDDGEKKRR